MNKFVTYKYIKYWKSDEHWVFKFDNHDNTYKISSHQDLIKNEYQRQLRKSKLDKILDKKEQEIDHQDIIDKAIELLTPIAKEISDDVSSYINYFTIDGDDDSEYDCCDNEDCVEKAKKEIFKNYGKNSIVENIWTTESGENDSYRMCCICGRYLNETLCWIESEFDHHSEFNITKNDIVDHIAFEILGMFEAFPAHDHVPRNRTNYEETIFSQYDFNIKVVDYAKLIIKELTK